MTPDHNTSDDNFDANPKDFKGTIRKIYNNYNERFRIESGDTLKMKGLKILGKIGGIIIMILLSPFVFIGLFFAIIAAG